MIQNILHKRTIRTFLTISLILVILLGVAGAYLYYSNRQSAIACVLQWGRLAPFPDTAQSLSLESTGSMFSRQFTARFVDTPEHIQQWISQSPGLNTTKPETISPGIQQYTPAPGGGAQNAQITIDETTGTVTIVVSWS